MPYTLPQDAEKQPYSICIFSALYAPSMGGVELYTENLANELVKLGHKATVITMNTHERNARECVKGVKVVRLPCRNALGGRYPLLRRNAEYREALQHLKAQHFDGVVVNTRFYPLSYEGLRFARKAGITPILIEHGSAHLTMGGMAASKVVEAVEHFMTWRIRKFRPSCYAVSRKASAWLSHFGITSSGELPNAINADEFAEQSSSRDFHGELGIAPEDMLVASAGRLVPEKGVLQLAEAAHMLEEAGKTVHVAFAGAGPLEEQLRKQPSTCVHILGKLNRQDLAALLTQADAYCLPSRSEGFATTLLEAAACKTPSIVTNVGGTDELIPNEEFGRIIDSTESEAIANALLKASSERDELAKQGVRAAKRVREFCSWEHTAEATLAACKRAQEKRRG